MELPVHELYTIEGEPGRARDKLTAAMDWLLSPAANGIGERLLRDAYAMHNKPLAIHCSNNFLAVYSPPVALMENAPQKMKFAYDEFRKACPPHAVVIDPRMIEATQFQTPSGEWDSLCLEAILAHEMRHASQDHTEHMKDNLFANEETFDEHVAKMTTILQAAAEKSRESKAYILQTPYQVAAEEHLRKIAEIFYEPLVQHYAKRHTAEYIEKYETDTLAIEGEVQRLKGRAARTQYVDMNERAIEAGKKMSFIAFKEQAADLLAGKRGIAPFSTPPKPWQEFVQDPTRLSLGKWEPNEREHPLIAQHKDGGRN